jgi:hypothetical protein
MLIEPRRTSAVPRFDQDNTQRVSRVHAQLVSWSTTTGYHITITAQAQLENLKVLSKIPHKVSLKFSNKAY